MYQSVVAPSPPKTQEEIKLNPKNLCAPYKANSECAEPTFRVRNRSLCDGLPFNFPQMPPTNSVEFCSALRKFVLKVHDIKSVNKSLKITCGTFCYTKCVIQRMLRLKAQRTTQHSYSKIGNNQQPFRMCLSTLSVFQTKVSPIGEFSLISSGFRQRDAEFSTLSPVIADIANM